MSRSGRNTLGSSNTVLAVHRQGTSLRLLLARLDGQSVAVKDATTLSAADVSGLTAAIQRLHPDRVIHVIPAGQTIWRKLDAAVPAADTPPAQVEAAMTLLAEASLPVTVPTHRRAAAALRTPGGAACVACGWVGDWPGGDLEFPEQWLPEPVALIAAARLLGRGPGLCIYADRSDGVVTVAAVTGGEKPAAFVRVVREDSSDAERWREAVSTVAAECAEGAGVVAPDFEAHADCDVVLPPLAGGAVSIPGVPASDRRWHDQFDVALGAAALALAPTPGERPLLAMHAQAPEFVEPVYLRAASALATPRKLAITVAACVALILIVPLALAYSRLSILQSKSAGAQVGSADEFQKAVEQAEWYQLLREKRWPMTRLLAELTTTAPEGVLVDDVTIEHGKTITINATAPSADVVSEWRETLNKGKVFEDAKVPAIDSSSMPVRFSMSVKVVAPMLAMADAVPAVGTSIAIPAPEPLPAITSSSSPRSNDRDRSTTGRTNRPGRTPNTGTSNSGNSGGGSGGGGASTEKPAPVEIPRALSDDQIAKMDQNAARSEFAKRRAASMRPGVNDDDKHRLESEAERLRTRLTQLQGGN